MGCDEITTFDPNTKKPKVKKYEEPNLTLDYIEEENLC